MEGRVPTRPKAGGKPALQWPGERGARLEGRGDVRRGRNAGERSRARRWGWLVGAGLLLAGLVSQALAQVQVTPVGQWPGYARGRAFAVAVSGTYAYVADGKWGLQILRIDGLPRLEIARVPEGVVLSWPLSARGYGLQCTPSLSPPAWQSLTNAPEISADRYVLSNAWSGPSRFFRLGRRKPTQGGRGMLRELRKRAGGIKFPRAQRSGALGTAGGFEPGAEDLLAPEPENGWVDRGTTDAAARF